MEVRAMDNSDVIYETMRQILAARAIHNIFRMTESHMLVTCDCLKWVGLSPVCPLRIYRANAVPLLWVACLLLVAP